MTTTEKTKETPKQEKPTTEKTKETKKAVDEDIYNEFIRLTTIVDDGGILNEQFDNKLKALTDKLINCSGHKPKISRTINLGSSLNIKIVKDIPVPDSVYKTIKEKSKNINVYF